MTIYVLRINVLQESDLCHSFVLELLSVNALFTCFICKQISDFIVYTSYNVSAEGVTIHNVGFTR